MTSKQKGSHLQVIGMIVVSMLMQTAILFRSTILAAKFGAGVELDAYNFSNNIVAFLISFMSSGITTVILPSYIIKSNRKSVDSFLTGLFCLLIGLLIILFFCRIPLIRLVSGKEGEFLKCASNLMGIIILIQIVSTMISVTTAHYHATENFITPKIISLMSVVGSVVILLAIKEFSIQQYVRILLCVSIIQLVVDATIAYRTGFRFCFSFSFADDETKQLIRTFLPVTISTGVYQLHSTIDSMIAAGLTSGSLTIMSFSNQMVNAFNTLVIGNLTTYIYPRIVNALRISRKEAVYKTAGYAVRLHLFVCLIIVCFLAVGKDAIVLVFGRGKFDQNAVLLTFMCTAIYMLGQQTNIVRDLIYRLYYAEKDTMTTFRNSCLVSTLNIILSLVLVKSFDLFGIVCATVLSGFVSLTLITIQIKRKYGNDAPVRNTIKEMAKTNLAMLFSILIVLITKKYNAIDNAIISIMVYSCLSISVYLLATKILKCEGLTIARGNQK